MLTSLADRILNWLARRLADRLPMAAAPERPDEAPPPRDLRVDRPDPVATLAPSAILGHDAVIANCSGGPETISVGENTVVRGRLFTSGHGGRIRIGDWCYVGERTEIWSMDSITIGDRVLIAHDVNIHDGTQHSLDPAERHAHFKAILTQGHPRDPLPGVRAAPVVIEDDAWISFGVTILKGVRIGRGAVVAARAIVTRDVPPHTLYRCEVTPVTTPLRPADEQAQRQDSVQESPREPA